jgi:hypothetical protein
MKHLLLGIAIAAASLSARAEVSVGASITIGDPNFYGVINIGDVPEPPRLMFREPIIIERVSVVREPAYLRVPPGHAKHWEKHCAAYHACGRPVYFVEDNWYENVYAPHYRAKHGHGGGGHGGGGHDGDHGGGHGKSHGGDGHGKGGGKGGKGKGGGKH